jgi:hypothetical protein
MSSKREALGKSEGRRSVRRDETGRFTDAGRADVKVVRTLTMPNGTGKRVMREDAFKRALSSGKRDEPDKR